MSTSGYCAALSALILGTVLTTGCNSTGPRTTANDVAQLAIFQLRAGNVSAARESAVRGLNLGDARQKGAFYVLISESFGSEGRYREAADAALAGQREDPSSIELAHLRMEYFSRAGDDAQRRAAERLLMALDPNYKREPTFDPVTGTLIGLEITALINHFILVPVLAQTDGARAAQVLKMAKAIDDVFAAAGMVPAGRRLSRG